MAVDLSDKEKRIFNDAREFALTAIAPYADQWETGQKSSREAMSLFAENGYCSPGISKKSGGGGYTFLESALIYEGLAHGDSALPSSILQLHNNIVYLIGKFHETNDVIRTLFPAMVRGQKRVAFAITEAHSGSDPSSMTSYAEHRHDGYHLFGEKAWIFNSLEADHFVITAKNGSPNAKQMLMFLVDRDTPGFTIGDNVPRIGNNCISCCPLYFDDCIIPEDRVMTQNGFRHALSFIDLPRIFVSGIAIGMAQRILDITSDVLGSPHTAHPAGSKRTASNHSLQGILFVLSTRIEAGRWLVYRTASKMDAAESIKVQSAMNKLFATGVAMDTITTCLHLLGNSGFDDLSVVNRYMDVAKLLQIVDGTSEIQKLVIGRALSLRSGAH